MRPSAVVDSSVLISAFLTSTGRSSAVLGHARRRSFELVVSPTILEEVRRGLLRPKLIAKYLYEAESVEIFAHELSAIGQLIINLPELEPICRDKNDDHVIAAALEVNATFLVTGDKDLLILGRVGTSSILTVREFLSRLDSDLR